MFWLIFTMVLSMNVDAQETRSRFSADNYARKAKENKILLDGNVNIVRGKTILKADHVEVNSKTDKFTATGNVNYEGNKIKITGYEIQGDLNSPKGFIKEGKIVSGSDIFEGKKIERLSEKHYFLEEGRYTSCFNNPPDWRLYGNKIDLTTGEYAHLEDVVVETFGLPIVYIPYMVVPIKDQRQSGFLTPNFGFGTDGFNIQESYFWAITRSQDMTFTLGHYNNRGFKQGAEFRSAYAPESFTNMYYFHIKDKKFSNIIVDDKPLNQKNRHAFKLNQEFKFFEDTYAKMNLLYVSDQNIPRDFPDEMEGRAEPALESKFLLTTHSNSIAFNTDVSYYQNLLSKNPLDRNREQLQRLPEVTVNVAKTKFSAFMFESDLSYLNVYRTGNTYDDMNGNQIFDDSDFIRTGQRFDVYPRLSMPLSNRIIKFTPQIGGRYDYYILPNSPSARRAYAEMKLGLSTEISRTFHRDEDKQYRALRHVIEPFVDYNVIPTISQSASPFFDAKNGAIEAPGFDSIDKIGRTNTITYGINNRLLTKYIKNFIAPKIVVKENPEQQEGPVTCESCTVSKLEDDTIMTARTQDFLGLREPEKDDSDFKNDKAVKEEEFAILQPVQWKLYQSYDFLDKTGEPFGYVYSDILAGYEWASLLLSNFYNVYTKKMGVNSRLRLSGSQKYIEMGYYNNKTDTNLNIDQVKLQFGFAIWRFGTNVRFILNNTLKGKFLDKLQDKYVDLTYQPPSSCWLLKLAARAPYDRPGVDVSLTFNLLISGQSFGFGEQEKDIYSRR